MYVFGLISLVLFAVAGVVVLLSALSPTKVEYTEAVEVDAPAADLFDDIRIQERLMRWSAWPKETGSLCAVDVTQTKDQQDGQVGSRTVFYSKGKKFGHQEVSKLEPNQLVTLTLESKGPPHTPRLSFRLIPISEARTMVELNFLNQLPRPFNAIWKFAGLSKWTRSMHLKDLAGLKAFSEPPHKDASGQVVGRPPQGENPYAYSASDHPSNK
jgi:hypothetical protein